MFFLNIYFQFSWNSEVLDVVSGFLFLMMLFHLLFSVTFSISRICLCFMDCFDKGLLSHYSLLCPTFTVVAVSLVTLCTCCLVPGCVALGEKCCRWPLRANLSGFLLRRFGLINFSNWILSVCISTLNRQLFLTFSVEIWSPNHCACPDKVGISDCVLQPRW